MALKTYKTLLKRASDEFIINKSRFIGYGAPAQTEEEALDFLAEVRSAHKDASHNCYAYIIGANMGVMRYSDDGEPGGTAGMPIIEVMKARGVTNCAVVVTRYFGGILLGAGGLTRAYTKGAKDALDAAGICRMGLWTLWSIPCSYGLYERLRLEIENCGGTVREVEYGAEILLHAAFPAGGAERFAPRLTELSAGSISMTAEGEEFLPGLRER